MTAISEAFSIALRHHQAGRLSEAEPIYRQILAADPNHAEAWHLLGVAACQTGRFPVAVECIQRALTHRPDWAEALGNLGNAWQAQGNVDEAVACYQRALQLKSDFAEALNNLGNVWRAQAKLDDAIGCYRRALQLKPDYADAHNNLGIAWQALGKHDSAALCLQSALQLKPDFAEASNNLGNTWLALGKLDEAAACYQRALQLQPESAQPHNNLGYAWQAQGKLNEAVACYRRALQLSPDDPIAHFNLGNALQHQEKLEEAIDCYRRALQLQHLDQTTLVALVHAMQHVCCWENLPTLAQRVIDGVTGESAGGMAAVSPFSFLALPIPTTARQQLSCARQWVDRQLQTNGGAGRLPARPRAGDRHSRLTIGYLSADFRSHPLAYSMVELFEKHDRDRFAVCGYSYGADDHSPIRNRLALAFDRFVELHGMPYADSAQRIADDHVDILIDLTGYTRNARTQIVALRPAPVQVSYWGYPGTIGAPFIDYILVDDFIVPADQQPYFTESLVHLPGCYLPTDSHLEIASRSPSRTDCGLPESGFVFCSFNNSYKITPAVFDVWMELLNAVPQSVLWLLEGNRFVAPNLRKEAQSRGIPPERLVFAPRVPLPEHLARHRLADLFLDNFPVNAHATASDALWAGCPLLTIAGETFVSRVAGSLLRSLGLPELITTSLEQYHELALHLARSPRELAAIRERLKANSKTSLVFDTGQLARHLESAYRTMWQVHAGGEKPRTFKVHPTTSARG